MEYFYREALRLQESATATATAPILEPTFRYPGPKPQNRENGIVMLADAVESSSRALTDPTPGSLRKLVHDLLMKRLLDGQFEESGLTLTELHLIEESLCKGLIALYHSRHQVSGGRSEASPVDPSAPRSVLSLPKGTPPCTPAHGRLSLWHSPCPQSARPSPDPRGPRHGYPVQGGRKAGLRRGGHHADQDEPTAARTSRR